MTALKYSLIKNREQYDRYCETLSELVEQDSDSLQDEIELLTLLIEKWDDDHNTFEDSDPVEIIKSLMAEHALKAVELSSILNLSKGTLSKILNYRKGLSKETIRKLSGYFKVSQEAFNRPYKLNNEVNKQFPDADLMNTRKKMAGVK